MKALPVLVVAAWAVMLGVQQRSSIRDTAWQSRKAAMQQIAARIRPGTTIGCPVDSTYKRVFYECRYWLAPIAVLQGNENCDTQLIIRMNNGQHAADTVIQGMLLHQIHTAEADYLLTLKHS